MRAPRVLAALAAFASTASAHIVQPPSLSLRPGGQDEVYVFDGGTCAATITVKSPTPSLVKVAAVDMVTGAVGAFGGQVTVPGRVDQLFKVRAEPGIQGSPVVLLEICWVGEDWPDPPCDDNNCSSGPPHFLPVTIDTDPLSIAGSTFCGVVGDPVTTDDGELFFVEDPEFDLGGPMSLEFERMYLSRGVGDGNISSALGPNWLSNFDWKLSSTGTSVEITTSSGRVIRFEHAPFSTVWKLVLYDDVPYQLVDIATTRVLGDPTTGYRYTFDALGQLTRIEDGRGNSHTLTHGASGPASVTDGLGRTLSFTYNPSHQLIGVGDGTRNVTFGYTGGQLTSATDADGKTTSYAYDSTVPGGALMTGRTRPNGNTPTTHAFDGSRRVTSETDALANTTTLGYDAASGETTVTDPLAHVQVHDHAAGARLTGFEDEGGSSASMTYDARGRRKSVTGRLGSTTSWTYHAPSGRIASMTEADGSVVDYGYTARTVAGLTFHDLTSLSYPGGVAESSVYDASGNMTSHTDRAGETWAYAYNARGQLLTATDPEGGVATLSYNGDGTLATSTDAASNTTTFGYDALRRVTLITRPDASTVAFTYDPLDRVLTLTDEESRTTTYGYDDNGNLVTITDPSSHTWTLAYDVLDRLQGVLDPEGNTATAAFDALGRISTLTNGAGDTVSVAYDARGYLVSLEDGKQNAWTFHPNAEGIPVSLVDPGNRTGTFTSDARGRVTRATTPLGRSTSYRYDALSRVTRITDPLGHAANYAYDARGALERVTLPAAGAVSATRNGTGRITGITYPGNLEWQFGFDTSGRMTSRTDPLGRTTSVTHDARNRVEQITFPGALGSGLCAWNDAGQLTDVDLSDGTSLHYAYDAGGRLVAAGSATFAWDGAGRLIDSGGIAIGRDAAGRIQSFTYAPGKVVVYAYDARGLLATITDWVGGVTTFTHDSAGLLTALARPNGVTTRFHYDDDSRLIEISEVVDSLHGETELAESVATYNLNDTIRSIQDLPAPSFLPQLGAIARTFDAAGQDTSLTHDDLGNVLIEGATVNTWDLAGRLKSRATPNGTDTFDYDDLGRLEVIQGPNGAEFGRNYASSGVVQVIRDTNGQDETYVVTTPAGGILYTRDATTDAGSFFHFDFNLSTRRLSDDGGNFTDVYEYDPRGVVLGHTGNSTQPFTYLGHYGVQQHGSHPLYFVFDRAYDAQRGSFLSADRARPLDPRASNPYTPELGVNAFPTFTGTTMGTIPQFLGGPDSSNRVSISLSSLVVLAPFGSYDTGLAIANTTSDPFGCSGAYRPGSYGESSARAPRAGSVLVPSRVDATPGFQGYIIAKCNFTYAHGFAFISDVGAQNLARGYLALVLDSGQGPAESTAAIDPVESDQQRSIRKWRLRFPPAKEPLRITHWGTGASQPTPGGSSAGGSRLVGGYVIRDPGFPSRGFRGENDDLEFSLSQCQSPMVRSDFSKLSLSNFGERLRARFSTPRAGQLGESLSH